MRHSFVRVDYLYATPSQSESQQFVIRSCFPRTTTDPIAGTILRLQPWNVWQRIEVLGIESGNLRQSASFPCTITKTRKEI